MGQVVTIAKDETFGSLKERQVDIKREIILNAAEKVFARLPFKKVSMREIAREAGISHATIYRYFPDQQTLFVEAFLKGVREIEKETHRIVEAGKEETLEEVAETFVMFLFEHDHYFKMMSNFMLEGGIEGDGMGRLNQVARSLLDNFESVFKKMGFRGNTRLLSHSFFAALNGILITFHDYPGRRREELKGHMRRLARLTARVFTQGGRKVSYTF